MSLKSDLDFKTSSTQTVSAHQYTIILGLLSMLQEQLYISKI